MPDTTPFTIRLPKDLKAALEKAAKEDERTMNNLIIVILKRWIKEREKD